MVVNRRKWIGIALVAVVLAAIGYRYFGTHNAPAGQPALAHLDAGLVETLRADFNRRADEVRIIVLLSPT